MRVLGQKNYRGPPACLGLTRKVQTNSYQSSRDNSLNMKEYEEEEIKMKTENYSEINQER